MRRTWTFLDSGGRDGLGTRFVRAMRLDPALYREVAATSGSTRQAVVIILITAVASSLSWGTLSTYRLLTAESEATAIVSGVVAPFAIPSIGLNAVAHVCAWLTWTLGLWTVGTLLAGPTSQARSFWALARALAFAQTPTVFRLATFALVEVILPVFGAEVLPSSLVRTLVWSIEAGTEVWVLVATFVAVRQALGLSPGRTVGSLILFGLTLSGLVGFGVVALVIASGRDALDPPTIQDLPMNINAYGAFAVGGLCVIFGSLFLHRGWHTLDRGRKLLTAGLVTGVLGVGATTLALIETIIPEVVGSRSDFPAAPAIAAGFDFNLDRGLAHSGWLVSVLSGVVLDAG